MTAIRIGSLFSGGGGLDMGVRHVIGGELAWMAEHYRPARRVLEHNHPNVPLYGDIAAVDWSSVPRANVVVAGFPCQKLSLLGRREGLRPGEDAAHLFGAPSGWDLTVRVLRAVRPSLVILENVSALLTAPVHDGAAPGSAFTAILADLADLGLDAEWVCADASAAAAPHRRRRVFIAAAAADHERVGWGTWRDRHPARVPAELGRNDAAGSTGLPDRPPVEVWGRFTDAVDLWGRRLGHGAPHPVLNRARNAALWEWLMGLPEGWLTGCGLSISEVQRVAGNGVVPQQVELALPVLLERLSEPMQAAAS